MVVCVTVCNRSTDETGQVCKITLLDFFLCPTHSSIPLAPRYSSMQPLTIGRTQSLVGQKTTPLTLHPLLYLSCFLDFAVSGAQAENEAVNIVESGCTFWQYNPSETYSSSGIVYENLVPLEPGRVRFENRGKKTTSLAPSRAVVCLCVFLWVWVFVFVSSCACVYACVCLCVSCVCAHSSVPGINRGSSHRSFVCYYCYRIRDDFSVLHLRYNGNR